MTVTQLKPKFHNQLIKNYSFITLVYHQQKLDDKNIKNHNFMTIVYLLPKFHG